MVKNGKIKLNKDIPETFKNNNYTIKNIREA